MFDEHAHELRLARIVCVHALDRDGKSETCRAFRATEVYGPHAAFRDLLEHEITADSRGRHLGSVQSKAITPSEAADIAAYIRTLR